jgi:hypothetical protein
MAKTTDIIAGLVILSKYGAGHEVAAEHDIILWGGDKGPTPDSLDGKRLAEFGWFMSDEFRCWARFV